MGAAFLTLVLLGIVLAVILGPLYALPGMKPRRSDTRADLHARREAKYQEIRDAELDFHTGKLSPEDHEAVDGTLRREALAILDQIATLDEAEQTEQSKASAV